ncbi:MAG: methyl-accepting chemotaxis protein [Leptolyngbyaceae cyanobacterium MO_188.B28]|nr:methyl-accepting chemotaxis protein [Leptolyngbyaceae cyanobacterium MO_188.B28]
MTHLPSKITPQNTKANSSVSSPKRIKVEDQISVADNSLLSRYQNRSNGSKVVQPQTFELFDIPAEQDQSRPSSIPLRQRLLRIFLPLALAPLAIASLVSSTIVGRTAQQQIESQLRDRALLASEAASQLVEDGKRIPLAIANNPLIINAVRTSAQKVITEGLDKASIEELEARFDDTHLLEINPILNNYLLKMVESEGLAEMHVTESHGFVITYSGKTSDFVQSDEEWWQNGKVNEQWISDPEIDQSANTFGVDFLQAISDPISGEFLGLIQAVLPAAKFDQLIRLLENVEFIRSEKLQLVDVSSGTVVNTITAAGPINTQEILGGEAIQQAITELVQASQDLGLSLEQVLESSNAQYSFRELKVTPIEHATGEQVLNASFYHQGKRYNLVTLPNIDWVAITLADTAEIQSASRNLSFIFSLIAFPLAGLAVLAALWLSNQLSSPLKELSEAAEQVSSGNLNITATPQGTTETQTLARTFNNLVARVKTFLQEQITQADKANLLAEITGSRAINLKDLDFIFSNAMEGAREILKADRILLYRIDSDGSGQIIAESVTADWPGALNGKVAPPSISEDLREAYQEGRVFPNQDVFSAEVSPEHLRLMESLGVKTNLVTPILCKEQLFGLLIADHWSAPYDSQSLEINFLRQLAGQLGLVIDRVILLEETENLAEEQRQLKESLQKRALQLLREIDPISRGDLTVRARVTADEIGTIADSYNATVNSLRKIVIQVQNAASQVDKTTLSNETSVQKLSAEAARQSAEITAALKQAEEMATAVQAVSYNAKQAERFVQQAAQTVKEGDAAMNRTVDGIEVVRSTVAETAKKVKRLGESSQKISTVVDLISGFAAQTNMLALNASIEASRAGQEGRGFAVVAAEVRELAQQSAEATEEIKQLVVGIQAETHEVVTAMESGTEQVMAGTQLVDETRQSLNKITAASNQINQLVEAIAKATAVQSQASETVTRSMTEVAEIAAKTSAEASQVSSSFGRLRKVAQTLQDDVGQFKLK